MSANDGVKLVRPCKPTTVCSVCSPSTSHHPSLLLRAPLASALYLPLTPAPVRPLCSTKVFLGVGVGVSHWGNAAELVGFESHDLALAASMLGEGWMHHALVRCRTGAPLVVPCEVGGSGCDSAVALAEMPGSGFAWYDTGQAHVVSEVTFRNCGVSTSGGAQRSSSEISDGCGDGVRGCHAHSSVWAMLTHSDQFVPEHMQATMGIQYQACGRRFRFTDFVVDGGGHHFNGMLSTVAARHANWHDADGTASHRAGHPAAPTILGSGVTDAGEWWQLDDHCLYESSGPLWQCKALGDRQIGSLNIEWVHQVRRPLGVTCTIACALHALCLPLPPPPCPVLNYALLNCCLLNSPHLTCPFSSTPTTSSSGSQSGPSGALSVETALLACLASLKATSSIGGASTAQAMGARYQSHTTQRSAAHSAASGGTYGLRMAPQSALSCRESRSARAFLCERFQAIAP